MRRLQAQTLSDATPPLGKIHTFTRDLLKEVFFLRHHNFTYENFAQEYGQKKSKDAHKVGKNGQEVETNLENHEFPLCTYKSQNVAQSQLNFAPSHNGETVTFRNSVQMPPSPHRNSRSLGPGK